MRCNIVLYAENTQAAFARKYLGGSGARNAIAPLKREATEVIQAVQEPPIEAQAAVAAHVATAAPEEPPQEIKPTEPPPEIVEKSEVVTSKAEPVEEQEITQTYSPEMWPVSFFRAGWTELFGCEAGTAPGVKSGGWLRECGGDGAVAGRDSDVIGVVRVGIGRRFEIRQCLECDDAGRCIDIEQGRVGATQRIDQRRSGIGVGCTCPIGDDSVVFCGSASRLPP